MSSQRDPSADALFAGPGDVRPLCRSIDWGATPLGPVEGWPQSLLAAVRLCLDSKTAMAAWAGPELTLIYNEGFAAVLASKHPEAMGRPARAVWPEVWDVVGPEVESVLTHGASTRHEDARFRIRRDGREQDAYFTYSFTPIREEDAHIVGLFTIFEETTTRVRARTEREEREALFSFAMTAAGIGAWDLDLVDGTAHRSPRHDQIFGYEPALPEWTYEMFLEHVLEDDRQEVDRKFREAADAQSDWRFECRIRRRDGEVRWISSSGRNHPDSSGRPWRMAGTIQDITERKQVEEALRASEARYRALFDSLDEGFCVIEILFDSAGESVDYRFLETNPAFDRHTGLVDAEGKTARQLVPQLEARWPESYGRIALTGEPERFEQGSEAMGRWFDVYAFRIGPPEERRVALLFSDITARRQVEKALRDANERLLEADHRKDEFLAVLSHELRNPLAPIRNSVYILEHATPGGEHATRARQVIERQMQHMTRLIDDLLDITRISRGKVALQSERVDLDELARRTAEDHREQFSRAGVELDVEGAGEPLWVDGDRTRLAQVVGNLLNNAAKFTAPGGRTVLSLEESEHGEAVVRVRDTGAGMSPETLERLFEPFMQAAQTIERTRGGLGLGLALVERLVEMHGGEVTAYSEGHGKGSELVVTLPLRPRTTMRLPAVASPQRSSSARRVLVVEDHEDAAESLREALELGDHEVAVAYSGPEGVDVARRLKPDVVLCDIGLPGFDGYGVARALRADPDPKVRSSFLVALSGYALPEDVAKSKEAGFDRHMAKPPSVEKLEELLGNLSSRAPGPEVDRHRAT